MASIVQSGGGDDAKNIWESVEQGEDGNLIENQEDAYEEQRKERTEALEKSSVPHNVRRGVIRYLQIVVDVSSAVLESDLKPNRLAAIKHELKGFVLNYYDQNPLSELAIILTRNQTAQQVAGFNDEKLDAEELFDDKHTNCLGNTGEGQPSLQNALNLACEQLKFVPPYGTREILVVMSALCTIDPGDIFATIEDLKREKVSVSIVGMAAEMYICERIAKDTGGKYEVAVDQRQLRRMLDSMQVPPAVARTKRNMAERITVGFPKQEIGTAWGMATPGDMLCDQGKECPRCLTWTQAQLPYHCAVCNLFLISSPHLCRSYHHIFGVPPFVEIKPNDQRFCYCCNVSLDRKLQLQCPNCKQIFAAECDIFIHEKLHNCPGCLNCMGEGDDGSSDNSTTIQHDNGRNGGDGNATTKMMMETSSE
jgi:transcription initiation factor TFIIH subunit 2